MPKLIRCSHQVSCVKHPRLWATGRSGRVTAARREHRLSSVAGSANTKRRGVLGESVRATERRRVTSCRSVRGKCSMEPTASTTPNGRRRRGHDRAVIRERLAVLRGGRVTRGRRSLRRANTGEQRDDKIASPVDRAATHGRRAGSHTDSAK